MKTFTLEYFRKQGKRGGLIRSSTLTPERRSEIAKAAAEVRWGDKPYLPCPECHMSGIRSIRQLRAHMRVEHGK